MTQTINDFAATIITYGAAAIIFLLILAVIYIGVLYVVDVSQTTHAIRRNYPSSVGFGISLNTWARSSANIFSPWTGRKCRSTANSAVGFTGPRRTSITRSHLA